MISPVLDKVMAAYHFRLANWLGYVPSERHLWFFLNYAGEMAHPSEHAFATGLLIDWTKAYTEGRKK